MNVRLVKTWYWQSGRVLAGDCYINSYTAKIQMHTTAMDAAEHSVAYERMDHWFQSVMQDSVLISAEDPKLRVFGATGQRILIFPEDPVDQLVGIMLCIKLNHITEGRLVITDVDLSSINGEEMTYRHNHTEATGPMAAAGWWQDPRPTWTASGTKSPSTKVVALSRSPEWHAVGLDWPNRTATPESAVVFADFDRDDHK
jgi:hypothetical protein